MKNVKNDIISLVPATQISDAQSVSCQLKLAALAELHAVEVGGKKLLNSKAQKTVLSEFIRLSGEAGDKTSFAFGLAFLAQGKNVAKVWITCLEDLTRFKNRAELEEFVNLQAASESEDMVSHQFASILEDEENEVEVEEVELVEA